MLLKVLIVLLPALITAQREPTCVFGREVYRRCAKNCNQICGIDNEAACFSIFCAPGCYCRPGFRRDPTRGDNCVPELECPLVCTGENEVFNQCGTNCGQTCGVDEENCNNACVRGCFCKPGYRRDPTLNNVCVLETNCPIICTGEHEIPNTCGTNCTEQICGIDEENCSDECAPGCFCMPGFRRNPLNNYVCVPEEQCPATCDDPNEEYLECGTNCYQECKRQPITCTEQCHPGCFCKKGYRRDIVTGECITVGECIERKCSGLNDFFSSCGSTCNDYCQKPTNCTECIEGCFCRNGYKRNAKRECVPQNQCGCDTNEEYKKEDRCRESCNSTLCEKNYEEGCFCKAGLKREAITGKCVPECQCPKHHGVIYCHHTEQYKCSNRCLEQCDKGQRAFCTKECYYGCFCKDTWARDPTTYKCVPESYYSVLVPSYFYQYVF